MAETWSTSHFTVHLTRASLTFLFANILLFLPRRSKDAIDGPRVDDGDAQGENGANREERRPHHWLRPPDTPVVQILPRMLTLTLRKICEVSVRGVDAEWRRQASTDNM
jgi:hypothetical protein